MFGFFRKIRKQLAVDNKPLKYLRYAIGEIVLIVVGILIALQINNTNEHRKALIAEKAIYSRIIDDLIRDSLSIETQLYHFKMHQEVHYQFHNETLGEAAYDPNKEYGRLAWTSIQSFIISANHSTAAANFINQEMRSKLNEYIGGEKKLFDAMKAWDDFKVLHIRPFLSEKGIFNTKLAFSYNLDDSLSLFFNDQVLKREVLVRQYGTTEFDQMLFNLRLLTSWVIAMLEEQKKLNTNLKHALKSQL